MNDQSTQIAPIVAFKRDLRDLAEKKEFALPSNVSQEAFINAAVVAFQDNPTIALAEKTSVFKSLRRLAAAGLVPDGREAALVPFKTKINNEYVTVCQAMPMVFGLIKTARNSGEVKDIRAHIVYEKEIEEGRFTYVVGDEEKLEHSPILFGDKGLPVAAYAIARLKDGSIIREFMDALEIERVRRSGASQLEFAKGERPKVSESPKGIWADWWGEMWKKTVIRRLCKRLPLSAEDVRRVMVDEDQTSLRDVTPKPTNPLAQKALAAREAAKAKVETPDAEVLPPEGIDYDNLDTASAFPGSDQWQAGEVAREDGKPITACPYDEEAAAIDWCGGWREADARIGAGEGA